jgi:hypothetical protein
MRVCVYEGTLVCVSENARVARILFNEAIRGMCMSLLSCVPVRLCAQRVRVYVYNTCACMCVCLRRPSQRLISYP